MNSICGILQRTEGPAAGLDAVLAALPGGAGGVSGAWVEGPAGLGWRADEVAGGGAAARGPLVDREAGLVLTASARLDDRESLCESLGVGGPERGRATDAALVLRAYRRWGAECPTRLLGDYAFAVWDGRRRTLFCARDHVGARPFYYCLTAERIVFASGVAAVLAAPGVSDALDEEAVATHLARGSPCLGAHTFYRAARRLPPGHLLAVEPGAARVERWWRPEDGRAAPGGDDDSLAEELLEIYGRAVADRVRGPDRVGVHLSGGLDSSSVAVLAAGALRRTGRQAPVAFSWQPARGAGAGGARETAEHDLIEAASRQAGGLPLFHCPPGVDDLVAWLRADVTRDADVHPNEGPVRRTAARLGVRVILSGWGGDMGISFNGRGYYGELLMAGRLGRLWREMGERSRHPLAGMVADVALPLAWPVAAMAVSELRRGRWPARKQCFAHPAFARRVPPLRLPRPPPRVGVRRVQLYVLQAGHLGDRVEAWAVAGARHGIEYRYPLLDRRVLEFALGLPPEQFRRGRWSRWLMRRALGRLLPPEVCWNRSKQDPARLQAVSNARAEALSEVRMAIEGRTGPQVRSRYLDMPRLVQSLRVDGVGASWPRGSGRLHNALRFLDF